MTGNRKLQRLEAVLDAYGHDAARWPASERSGLRELIDQDPAARRLFAEAEALAQVMAAAPAMTASPALRARIMEQVQPSDAAELPPRTLSDLVTGWWQSWLPAAPALPAAGLLAASLAVGIYIGAMGFAQPVFQGASDYAQANDGAEDEVSLFVAPEGSDFGLEALL